MSLAGMWERLGRDAQHSRGCAADHAAIVGPDRGDEPLGTGWRPELSAPCLEKA